MGELACGGEVVSGAACLRGESEMRERGERGSQVAVIIYFSPDGGDTYP